MSHLGGKSFFRFLLVGGTATGLHYAIMFGLMHYGLCSKGFASATGYSLSTLFNYWVNARFTFGGQHSHAKSMPKFIMTATAGLGINQLILLSLTHFGLPVALAQIVATGTVLVWNYVINAIWSFRSRHTT